MNHRRSIRTLTVSLVSAAVAASAATAARAQQDQDPCRRAEHLARTLADIEGAQDLIRESHPDNDDELTFAGMPADSNGTRFVALGAELVNGATGVAKEVLKQSAGKLGPQAHAIFISGDFLECLGRAGSISQETQNRCIQGVLAKEAAGFVIGKGLGKLPDGNNIARGIEGAKGGFQAAETMLDAQALREEMHEQRSHNEREAENARLKAEKIRAMLQQARADCEMLEFHQESGAVENDLAAAEATAQRQLQKSAANRFDELLEFQQRQAQQRLDNYARERQLRLEEERNEALVRAAEAQRQQAAAAAAAAAQRGDAASKDASTGPNGRGSYGDYDTPGSGGNRKPASGGYPEGDPCSMPRGTGAVC